VILPKGENEDYYKEKFNMMMKFIMEKHFSEIKFSQEKESFKLVIVNRFENPEKIYEFLFKFSKDVSRIINTG
jgi:hypothetical protein